MTFAKASNKTLAHKVGALLLSIYNIIASLCLGSFLRIMKRQEVSDNEKTELSHSMNVPSFL